MPRVVHFEIHAEDPERAERFYTGVFGWEMRLWEGPVEYRLVTTGPDEQAGINGAVLARRDSAESPEEGPNAYVCTVDVESIADTERRVAGAGGRQVTERMAVPGVGHLAYFKDTEGNVFGAMQADPEAGR